MELVQHITGYLQPHAFDTITVSTSAVGFTASKVLLTGTREEKDKGDTRYILVTVEGTIRWTMHGSNPVAGTTGHLASNASVITFGNRQAMLNFRAISEDGSAATLQVTYLR